MAARTLAVGDIHGCLSNLDALLESIAPTAEDHLILLGDYIDRGSDSAGVIKRVLKLSTSHRITAVKGNHEDMLLSAGDSHAQLVDWLRNGGDATLRSYGGARATLKDIPKEHLSFIKNQLVAYAESDSHIFVHASAYPDLPMSEQPDYMLRWERCDSIRAHESGKTIVCGHTPQKSGRPLNKGFAICLDTYACGGGPLTCLDVCSGRVWQADANGRVSRSHISDFLED